MVIKWKALLMAAVLVSVCACMNQEGPPLPEDAVGISSHNYIEFIDPLTGDVTLQYTLFIKNITGDTLEKVILKKFLVPEDIIMEGQYFEIHDLGPGKTEEVTFEVIVLGWGLNAEDRTWNVDFSIETVKGGLSAEQDTFYYTIRLYT
jgi:hypothetical protein